MVPVDAVRKIATPVTPDAWALPGGQVVPSEATVTRLRVTSKPVRWRVVPYDGVNISAQPVDGDATTIDAVLVKIRSDAQGNESLARCATIVETSGGEEAVGRQITDDDVSVGETFIIGIISTTLDSAAAIWLFIDEGAELAT